MAMAETPGMSTNLAASRKLAREPGRAAPRWARWTATLFGIGYLRPGPGAWASAATVLLWRIAAAGMTPSRREVAAILAAIAVMAIGIPAATRVARAAGKRDPSHVVIDEVAGQLIALVGVPLRWQSLLAGFILFRAFDILKPPPVRHLESLPEGAGIVLDDVAAGLYVLLVMQALLRLGVG
jgi:phosphatidylglycerophosphatase A